MANFQTTPLAIDAYARYMVDSFDERQVIAVSTVFQSFFGVAANGGRTLFSEDSAVVDIDILRGNERLAAMVHRGQDSRDIGTTQKNANQEKYSTISRIYPLIEEESDIGADQLLFRRAGENPFSGRTRLDRMRGHALDIHQEHARRIIRLFEYLAGQSLLTGKMPAIFGTSDTNLLYDFLRNANNTFAAPTKWDNALSDPLTDVDDACDLIRQNGKAMPDIALIGDSAFNAFVAHASVIALADNRRFELINIGSTVVPANLQRFVDAGAIPRGRLRTPRGYELWLFTYLDVYTAAGGTATKYMPVDKAIVAASTARMDRYFGPPEKLPDVPMRDQLYQQLFGFAPDMLPMPPRMKAPAGLVTPAMFYCDAYTSANWKRVTCRTQAAPIFATTQTDAVAVITTLV